MAGQVEVANVIARFRADTRNFTAGMRQMQASTKQTTAMMRSVGRSMTTWITAPVALAVAGSVREFAKFEKSMQSIVALVGVSQTQVNAWAADVKALASETGRPATELAEGLYFVTSAGIDASNAMNVLEASAKASAAGLGETAVVADAVTSAVNAYGAANITAKQATDVLVATVREGKAEADTLAAAIGRIIAPAEAMGVEFNQVGAAIATFTRVGASSDEAVTMLRALLTTFSRELPRGAKALDAVGLSFAELRAQIASEGLLPAMQRIREEFGGNIAALTDLFGNVNALNAFLQLTGQSADEVDALFKRMNATTGDTDKAFNAMAQTLQHQFNTAMADIRNAFIQVSATAGPVLADLARVIATVARWFGRLPGPVRSFVIAGLAIAAIAGPILLLIGKVRALAASWGKVTVAATTAAAAQTAAGNVPVTGGGGVLGKVGGKVKGVGAALGVTKLAVGGAIAAATVGYIAYNKAQDQARENANKMADDLANNTIPTLLKTGKTIQVTATDTEYLGGLFGSGQRKETAKVFEAMRTGAMTSADAMERLREIAAVSKSDWKTMWTTAYQGQVQTAFATGNLKQVGIVANTAFSAGAVSAEEFAATLRQNGVTTDQLGQVFAETTGPLQYLVEGFYESADAADAAKSSAEDIIAQKQAWDEWKSGVVDAIDPVKNALGELATDNHVTANDIVAAFREQKSGIDQLAADYKKIGKRGAPKEVIDALREMGPEGAAIAATMAKANKTEFKRIVDAIKGATDAWDSYADDIEYQVSRANAAVAGMEAPWVSPFAANDQYGKPHAKGDIVTGPTLALVGEKGPELILPLSKSMRRRRQELMSRAGLGIPAFAQGGFVGYDPDKQNEEEEEAKKKQQETADKAKREAEQKAEQRRERIKDARQELDKAADSMKRILDRLFKGLGDVSKLNFAKKMASRMQEAADRADRVADAVKEGVKAGIIPKSRLTQARELAKDAQSLANRWSNLRDKMQSMKDAVESGIRSYTGIVGQVGGSLSELREAQKSVKDLQAEQKSLSGKRDVTSAKRMLEIEEELKSARERAADAKVSGKDLMGDMRSRLADAKKFSQTLILLSKKGLNKGLLEQFAQAGPEALPQMQAVLEAGVGSVNAVQSQIDSLIPRTANQVNDNVFGKEFKDLKRDTREHVRVSRAMLRTLRRIGGFASGGIVTKPQLAMVGEKGPEAIVPLDGRHALSGGGARIETIVVNIYPQGHVLTDKDLTDLVHKGLLQKKRRTPLRLS